MDSLPNEPSWKPFVLLTSSLTLIEKKKKKSSQYNLRKWMVVWKSVIWVITKLISSLLNTIISSSCFAPAILLPNWVYLVLNSNIIYSSTLAWEILWIEEPGRLQSMGSWGVRHSWATSLSLFTFMHWRWKWQHTPVFLPGESKGREPCGLLSVGSHRVAHDWRPLAAAAEGSNIDQACFPFCENK